MKTIFFYIFLFISTYFFLNIACKATKQQLQAPSPKSQVTSPMYSADDSIFASIERTPCYGRCPTYKITIYKSGYVIYEGIRFVDRLGTYSTRISEKQIKAIINKANETGYFDFNEVYDSPVTDLPSTITYLSVKGHKKAIKNRVRGPEALKEYEKYFDALFEDVEWEEINILKD